MEKFYSILFADETWLTILKGVLATLKISFFSVIFGTILGLIICFLALRKNKLIRLLADFYIAVVRGVPVLMFLMLMYYVVFANSTIDASWVAITTFSINTAAYVAALMTTAIKSTDKGQVEAARCLGFNKVQSFLLVTLPQARTIARPVYESTVVNLIQWTSVVGYVTITDLTRVINTVSARTMQPVFMIIIGMLLYLAMAYIVKGIFAFSKNLSNRKKVI